MSDLTIFLAGLPIFAVLAPDQLAECASNAATVSFSPGAVVFNQGDPPDHLYVIEEGEIEIVLDPGPTQKVLARRHQNEMLGEMGVIDTLPRSAAAIAVAPSLLLRFDRAGFQATLAANVVAEMKVRSLIMQRRMETITRLRPS